MRQTYYDKTWLYNADGSLLGVCLGYDRCGEHEGGIDDLKARFGISLDDPRGIGDRKIQTAQDRIVWFSSKKRRRVKGVEYTVPVGILASIPEWESVDRVRAEYIRNPPSGLFIGASTVDKPDEFQAAWGRSGFSITAVGGVARDNLSQLASAFETNDVCVSTSGSHNPYAGSGLCLTIASRVPKDLQDRTLEHDLAHLRLKNAAAATGLEQALAEAGVSLYCFEARWADAAQSSLKFYLGARRAQGLNTGWYSEADLSAWIEDNKGNKQF